MSTYTHTISGPTSTVDGATDCTILISFDAPTFIRFELDEDYYISGLGLAYRDPLTRAITNALAEYDAHSQAEIDYSCTIKFPSDNGNNVGVTVLNNGSVIDASLTWNGVNAGSIDLEHLRAFLTLLLGAPTS